MKAICTTQRIQGILWLVNGDGIERKRAQVCEAEPEAGWGGSELPDSHRPPPPPLALLRSRREGWKFRFEGIYFPFAVPFEERGWFLQRAADKEDPGFCQQ